MAIKFVGHFKPKGKLKIYHLGAIIPPTAPVWSNGTGLIATVNNGTTQNISLGATDPNNNIASYALTSGTLPPGLSLNTLSGFITGTISGVTTDTGYAFSVLVTDTTNLTLTGSFTINVLATGSSVQWQTNSGTVGMPAPGQTVTNNVQATSS